MSERRRRCAHGSIGGRWKQAQVDGKSRRNATLFFREVSVLRSEREGNTAKDDGVQLWPVPLLCHVRTISPCSNFSSLFSRETRADNCSTQPRQERQVSRGMLRLCVSRWASVPLQFLVMDKQKRQF
jgi:hypothetical protein